VYTDQVELTVLMPAELSGQVQKEITEATGGRAVLEELERLYYGSAD